MKFRSWDINLKVRLFGEALLDISFWTVFPFLTIYFSQTIGHALTSILLIVSQIFAVFTALLGGYFADHYGRKRMMSISVIGEGIGFLIFALGVTDAFYSPYLSFLGFMIASTFLSFYQPASQAMIADVVKPEHRSYVFSVFYMMINIAVVIGPIIGSFTFHTYKMYTLVIIAATDFFLFFLLQKFGRETAPNLVHPKSQIGTPNKNIWNVFVQQLQSYKLILKDKVFFLYVLAGIIVAQAFMQLDLLFPLYIKEVIGRSTLFGISLSGEQLFGLILSINGFCVVAFTIIVTRIMIHFKEKWVFMNSSFFYGLAILLFAFSNTAWNAILAIIIFSFAELMTVGIQQNFISKIAPENKRAMYFSAAGLRYTLGKVIAPFTITLSTLIHYQATFIMITLFTVLSGFIYIYMYKEYEKQPNK